MLRSLETYRLKEGTLSPVALGNRSRDSFVEAADVGDEIDVCALGYASNLMRNWPNCAPCPEVARLHALCCADHIRAIVKRRAAAPRTMASGDRAAR